MTVRAECGHGRWALKGDEHRVGAGCKNLLVIYTAEHQVDPGYTDEGPRNAPKPAYVAKTTVTHS